MVLSLKNEDFYLSGAPVDGKKVVMISGRVIESFSKPTEIRAVFAIGEDVVQVKDLVGVPYVLHLRLEEGERIFKGTCVEAEYLGVGGGGQVYALELRTWDWFLKTSGDTRVFQELSIPDIIKQVCNDRGYSSVESKVSGYPARTYIAQYDESDYDFIHRRMEEEGLYYYFDHSLTPEKMLLVDNNASHAKAAGDITAEFFAGNAKDKRQPNSIFELTDSEGVRTGQVTVNSYEFTTARTSLLSNANYKQGVHGKNNAEFYSMAGRHRDVSNGEKYARIFAEQHGSQARRWYASTNNRKFEVGKSFKIEGGDTPREMSATTFLAIEMRHYLNIQAAKGATQRSSTASGAQGGAGGGQQAAPEPDYMRFMVKPEGEGLISVNDPYAARVVACAADVQFRPQPTTQRPFVTGVHLAEVVGPQGEEIYTDEYGRIKVQFWWDRVGGKDENSSCWVRVAQPLAHQGFGNMNIPRIGSEVVIAFHQNDPDYPIVMGSLYNSANQVPYTLPDNMTQTGFKTQSTKQGTGFHELVFEDKKDAEFIRLQSERDWFEKIKNNAEITIGLEHKDPGDMTLTIHNSLTEKLNEGDHSFTVDKGKQDVIVEGNQTNTVRSGDQTNTVSAGNQTVDIKKKQSITVGDEISIVCGAASLTMKKDGTIELKGKDVTFTASAAGKFESGANMDIKAGAGATVKASASATVEGGSDATLKSGGNTSVKGSMVNIN